MIFKIYIFGFAGSFCAQTFTQMKFGENTAWGFNRGWQNEIAIWNVFAILILTALITQNIQSNLVLSALAILSLGFGANHLISYRETKRVSNLYGFLANVGGLLAIAMWLVAGQ